MAEEPENIDPIDLAEVTAWPPIPDAELAKGTTLTPERLIELGAIHGDPQSSRWAFRLLRLRDDIHEKSRAMGKPLSVRICKAGLHINTDVEATHYHNDRGENGLSMVRRQVQMLATVIDTRLLSSAEQARHDRSLCLWGARMASLKRAGKSLGHSPGGPAAEHGGG